jgi:hypothetical protein
MKVDIDLDERYPVYTPHESANGAIVVDDELYRRYIAAVAEFNAVQAALGDLWDKAQANDPKPTRAHPLGQACARCLSEGEYHS